MFKCVFKAQFSGASDKVLQSVQIILTIMRWSSATKSMHTPFRFPKGPVYIWDGSPSEVAFVAAHVPNFAKIEAHQTRPTVWIIDADFNTHGVGR